MRRGGLKMEANEVTFRFYAGLNDLLLAGQRRTGIRYRFDVSPAVKDSIEALGVPHVEVDLILVNGLSVGFNHRLRDGDRVAVYPVFTRIDVDPTVRLRDALVELPTFIADVHLRRLARLLRLLGFDVLHSNAAGDAELVGLSVSETRVLLSRDRQLLKHGRLTYGYWVRSTDPVEQAREVVRRFDLSERVRPFSRCSICNGELRAVDKAAVAEAIPPKTARWLDTYARCTACGKLYWRGTHFDRIERLIQQILEDPAYA